MQHSVKLIFFAGVINIYMPMSLLGQNHAGEPDKANWVPRPKIYQIQSSIEASKKDALRARGEVREEYLGILNDVEEAIKSARNAANRHHQQDVLDRLEKLRPALQQDSKSVESNRQSALNELRKGGYRQGDQIPSKPSRFMRTRTAVKRITPPEKSFDPRKSSAEVMPRTHKADFRKNISLNPIRWFWKRSPKPELISGSPLPENQQGDVLPGVQSNAPSPRSTIFSSNQPTALPPPPTPTPVATPSTPVPTPVSVEESPGLPVPPAPEPMEPVDLLSIDPAPVPLPPVSSTPEEPIPTLPPLVPVESIVMKASIAATVPPVLEEPNPIPLPKFTPIPEVEIPDFPIPEPLPPVTSNDNPEDYTSEYMKEFDAYSQKIQKREERILQSLQELNALLEDTDEVKDTKAIKPISPISPVEKMQSDVPTPEIKTAPDQASPNEQSAAKPLVVPESPAPLPEVEEKPQSKFKKRTHRLSPN